MAMMETLQDLRTKRKMELSDFTIARTEGTPERTSRWWRLKANEPPCASQLQRRLQEKEGSTNPKLPKLKGSGPGFHPDLEEEEAKTLLDLLGHED
ncbi:putative endoplasmic reticulum mannosyl-oligosaccharide 1,2-alpha-mannosidase [Sesbania bispinosa]|nr:putative endoplasmic reticulum mannosyl-oligosaccharide 1,2-alpha-mannosidase [Sesbania bispinosa]